MTKKMKNEHNNELLVIFFKITKAVTEAEKIASKYKSVELHDGLARIYKGMEIFSAEMMKLTLEAADGNN